MPWRGWTASSTSTCQTTGCLASALPLSRAPPPGLPVPGAEPLCAGARAALLVLPSLFSCTCRTTPLDHSGARVTRQVGALRWLYLSGNRLTRVSPWALGPARELEQLHLDRNRLGEVPTEALEGCWPSWSCSFWEPRSALRDGALRPWAVHCSTSS